MRRRSSTTQRTQSSTAQSMDRSSQWSTSSSASSYAASSESADEHEPLQPRSEVDRYLRAPFSIAPEVAGPLLQLSVDLLRSIREAEPGNNALLSPWHVACMMVSAYHGASGATRRQIARALYTDDGGGVVARLDAHAGRLFCSDYRKPRHTHSGLNVTTYCGLYHDARVNVSLDFQEPLSSINVHMHMRDFSGSPQQCHLALDGFFRALAGFAFEQDVFAGDTFDSDTLVVLASVYNFGSGRWFIAGDAAPLMGLFHPESGPGGSGGGSDEEVPMVRLTGPFKFAQFSEGNGFDVSVVDLPYQDPRRSTVIFLPAKTSSLASVEKALTAAAILTCLSRLEHRGKVEVTFPRINVKCLTDLKHHLRPMGVVDAFGDTADFANMAPLAGLRLSAVRHLAVFSAGHKGPNSAEAQAAASEAAPSASGGAVVKMVVDRPFLFAVLRRDPDTVLLLGSVVSVAESAARTD